MAITPIHNEAGFTLVEILCVLALLGLTAGLVVMNLPRGEDPFDARMERIATQFNIAQRDSTIDGKMRGVEIDKDGFELLQYSGDWTSLTKQSWGEVYGVTLKVENENIDFKDRAKILKKSEGTILSPLVFFDPTGGVTDFELEIEGANRTFAISTDERGRVIAEPVQ